MPIQKLSAQNNGWTKKEAKIFRRNSVISQIEYYIGWIGIGNCGQNNLVFRYLVPTTLVYHILCLSMKLRVLANKDISGHFWQQLSVAIGDIRVQL